MTPLGADGTAIGEAIGSCDALDRLTGAGGTSYTYNGDGLRVQAGTTRFTWDLGQSVPQLLNDGSDHVWGPTGLLAAVAPSGCVTYAFNDGLGSVQATKSSGGTPPSSTPTTQRFGAFGILALPTPLATPTDPCAAVGVGYAGERTDATTGLVYLRARATMTPARGGS